MIKENDVFTVHAPALRPILIEHMIYSSRLLGAEVGQEDLPAGQRCDLHIRTRRLPSLECRYQVYR